MTTGTQSRTEERETESTSPPTPKIRVCETCPERLVFMESGNSDGWLSSDTVLDVTR
jgi:hypothetical protein